MSETWSSMNITPVIFQGSFKCSPCKPSFIGDGYLGCYPGDLCTSAQHTCQVNAQCSSTGAGKYKCTVWTIIIYYMMPVNTGEVSWVLNKLANA